MIKRKGLAKKLFQDCCTGTTPIPSSHPKTRFFYSAVRLLHTMRGYGDWFCMKAMAFPNMPQECGELTVTFQLNLYDDFIPYFKNRHQHLALSPKTLRKTNMLIYTTNFLFLLNQHDNVTSGDDSRFPKPPLWGM